MVDDVGYWYKRQPDSKKGRCVILKDKGKKKGFVWELKKCKSRKYSLCETSCDAGM